MAARSRGWICNTRGASTGCGGDKKTGGAASARPVFGWKTEATCYVAFTWSGLSLQLHIALRLCVHERQHIPAKRFGPSFENPFDGFRLDHLAAQRFALLMLGGEPHGCAHVFVDGM